jgi:stalled ribosome alternative rescue factor ArfA
MKLKASSLARNEHAHALHTRAGNAGAAIRVDTRPKIVRPKKGKASYRRNKMRPP